MKTAFAELIEEIYLFFKLNSKKSAFLTALEVSALGIEYKVQGDWLLEVFEFW